MYRAVPSVFSAFSFVSWPSRLADRGIIFFACFNRVANAVPVRPALFLKPANDIKERN
jgi:hypothetical protein